MHIYIQDVQTMPILLKSVITKCTKYNQMSLRSFEIYLKLNTFKATFYSSSQVIIFANDE